MVFSFYDSTFTSEQKEKATEVEELFKQAKKLFSNKGYNLVGINISYTEDKYLRHINISE
jgi:hypothetical protein